MYNYIFCNNVTMLGFKIHELREQLRTRRRKDKRRIALFFLVITTSYPPQPSVYLSETMRHSTAARRNGLNLGEKRKVQRTTHFGL